MNRDDILKELEEHRDAILGSEFGASESSERTPAKPNESGLT
jgi:hypothetical protein